MATFEMLTAPIGSQFCGRIVTDDPENLNDFQVFIMASENVTGLELFDFSFTIAVDGSTTDISDDMQLLSLDGKNSVWVANDTTAVC